MKKTIYQQDCEQYRFQDQLKWSRLKTISIIEGAMIAAYVNQVALQMKPWLLLLLLVAGTVLVALFILLAIGDRDYAHAYRDRARKYEAAHAVELLDSFSLPKWMYGFAVLIALATVAIGVNTVLILSLICAL